MPIEQQDNVLVSAIFGTDGSTAVFDQVFHQIDTDRSGGVTMGELRAWFMRQQAAYGGAQSHINPLATMDEIYGGFKDDGSKLDKMTLIILLQEVMEHEWHEIIDDATDRSYYRHKTTGQVLWKLPPLNTWLEQHLVPPDYM